MLYVMLRPMLGLNVLLYISTKETSRHLKTKQKLHLMKNSKI